MDHFGSHQTSDQDREPQYNPLEHKAPPPNTGQWANIVITVIVLAVIAGGVFWGWRVTKRIQETVAINSPEVIEASWSVNTANDGMVHDSAIGFPIEELVARPENFKGKWLFTDSQISWLMDQKTGEPIDKAAAKVPGECIFWLEGPLMVKDNRDVLPEAGPGAILRPWGKLIEVPADKLGLSDAGMEKLKAMDGYNGETVAMIIARFVEYP